MKIIKALTQRQYKRLLRTPGAHNVGGCTGLMVQVTGELTSSWVLRYRAADGRLKHMGLGSTRDIDLEKARAIGLDKRALIAQRIDPLQQRRDATAQARLTASRTRSFSECFSEFAATKAAETQGNRKHREQWLQSIERFVLPVIGD